MSKGTWARVTVAAVAAWTCAAPTVAVVVFVIAPPVVAQTETKQTNLQHAREMAEQGDASVQFDADQGHALAQVNLAMAYVNGEGVARDMAEAVKWYRMAAEQGNASAQFLLGVCYHNGEGVAQDLVEAVTWWRKAAEQGHAIAQFNLGLCYKHGKGVAQDLVEALTWYRKAAEQGEVGAQFNLALWYVKGEGVTKDMAAAMKWYRKAAERGHAGAQFNLGMCYWNGEGVAQDLVEAVTWYRKAAEQEHASAQFNLAQCYMKGEGVAKDVLEAVRWYRRAAEQGYASAQVNLGARYQNGEGVAQDWVEAVKWYREAAEHGHAVAQFNLGVCYDNGQRVAQDSEQAVHWYTRAANQGNVDAQYNLSAMYARRAEIARDRGDAGVPQYYVKAHMWASIAANGERPSADESWRSAKNRRDLLAQKMTPAEIAEAQQLAAKFKPRPEVPSSQQDQPVASIELATASGSGFFITDDGYFVTNHHVIEGATEISIRTPTGTVSATIVRDDPANDIAVLKASGSFSSLYVKGSRGLKLAERVATVGFPNPALQGTSAKYTSGEISSLAGPGDDPRFLQISVPIQPGNSGGPLVDGTGAVVGVVVGQLDKIETLRLSGNIPENVNYAIKGTMLLGILESVPGLSEKLKAQPGATPKDQTDVAQVVEQASGLVLVEK